MAIDINEAIAVVGLDLKFPGDAASPESFYEMLLRGRSALSEIPSDRFNLDSFYHPDAERAGAVSLHLASTSSPLRVFH
jgi:acyl transferase domain-containing protein